MGSPGVLQCILVVAIVQSCASMSLWPHQQHKLQLNANLCSRGLALSSAAGQEAHWPKEASLANSLPGAASSNPAATSSIHTAAAAAPAAAAQLPPSDWMSRCSDKRLRQLFLPGTHDSGTYRWTTPTHMPLVLDEVLALLFNIVGDLSRTQKSTVYEQLQAGARVLDIRLAVNPWLAVQARQQQHTAAASNSSSSSSSNSAAPRPSLLSRAAAALAALHTQLLRRSRQQQGALQPLQHPQQQQQQQQHPQQQQQQWQQQQTPGLNPMLGFSLDPVTLEGTVGLAAAGGPLTAAERRGCIVTSHSLPGAPLVEVLRDVARFLAENPSELVVMMVKADTVDVNVAGSLRFTPQDWSAAAAVFQQELQGVQLVDEQQVQALTLGQLAAGSRGGGSVLLYSSELRAQGLVAVSSRRARIVESWGNGTNTEDIPDLKERLIRWLQFWRGANTKPFLLLASAEVTLGVRTILTMVKNRIWRWQQAAAQQLQLQQPAGLCAQQQRRLLRALQQWKQVQGWTARVTDGAQQQLLEQQHSIQLLGTFKQGRQGKHTRSSSSSTSSSAGSMLASGLTTLYQLGVETNRQMLQDILNNSEVPKEFDVWSLDAASPDITNAIISLNDQQPTPSA